ncbi:MAG: MFS transporter [Opitutales bacterium]
MADPPPNPAPAGAPATARRPLAVLFFTLFLDLVGFSIIFPLFPAMLDYYLAREVGTGGLLSQLIGFLEGLAADLPGEDPLFVVTVLFGGILGSLYALLQFVCAPIWGRLSDRHGRRPILLLTLTGGVLAYAVWVVADSFALLLVSRFIGGIMAGNLSVANAAVADLTTRQKRSAGMALVGVAFGLGFTLGPAIGGLSALWNPVDAFPGLEAWGLHPFSLPAAISCGLALINLVWVWCRFGESLPPENRATAEPGRLLAVFAWGDLTVKPARRATLVFFLFILAFSGMEFTLTFLAAERLGYGPRENGLMFLLIGGVLILVQGGFVRRQAARIGEKRLAVAGLALALVALAMLGGAHSNALFLGGLAVMATGAALVNPTLAALVSLYAPDDRQGAYIGVQRSAGSLGRAVGPLVAALLYFSLGSASAYLLGGIWLLLPLALAVALPQPRVTSQTVDPESRGQG